MYPILWCKLTCNFHLWLPVFHDNRCSFQAGTLIYQMVLQELTHTAKRTRTARTRTAMY